MAFVRDDALVDQQGGQQCPKCGYQAEPGAPICGNCGQPLGGYATQVSIASGGSGFAKLVMFVFILGGIGFLIWFMSGRIGDFFEDSDFFDDARNAIEGEVIVEEDRSVPSPYKTVRELAKAINEGGLRCTEIKEDAANEFVATGSCQAPGNEFARTHVQINIYFDRNSLEASREIFGERSFTYVHDANWFVITQPKTAREVHKILGGRFSLAKDL